MRKKPPLHARLSPSKAAEYLGGLSTITLAQWRVNGEGPQYLKLGGRVFYDTRDLDRWIKSNKFTSTSDYAAAR